MKEIITGILKEEKAAQARLDSARKEAEDIVVEAKKQARVLIEETGREVSAEADRKRTEMRQAWLTEKENILKAAREEAVGLRRRKEKAIPKTASQVFRQIIEIS